jgi:hypothetical protein
MAQILFSERVSWLPFILKSLLSRSKTTLKWKFCILCDRMRYPLATVKIQLFSVANLLTVAPRFFREVLFYTGVLL